MDKKVYENIDLGAISKSLPELFEQEWQKSLEVVESIKFDLGDVLNKRFGGEFDDVYPEFSEQALNIIKDNQINKMSKEYETAIRIRGLCTMINRNTFFSHILNEDKDFHNIIQKKFNAQQRYHLFQEHCVRMIDDEIKNYQESYEKKKFDACKETFNTLSICFDDSLYTYGEDNVGLMTRDNLKKTKNMYDHIEIQNTIKYIFTSLKNQYGIRERCFSDLYYFLCKHGDKYGVGFSVYDSVQLYEKISQKNSDAKQDFGFSDKPLGELQALRMIYENKKREKIQKHIKKFKNVTAFAETLSIEEIADN